MKRYFFLILFFFSVFPFLVSATTDPLSDIYQKRGDLQTAFDVQTHRAVPGSSAGFLINLEDWARQYGWQEYDELATYKPIILPPVVRTTTAPSVTASHYVVVDEASGSVLAEKHAGESWPIASITKLMTTDLLLTSKVNLDAITSVKTIDNVGGATLHVADGTTFTLRDLLAATLMGSANNAAHAIARTIGGDDFVSQMNARATEFDLGQTRFVDPTGMDPRNVSTAREIAKLAETVFDFSDVHRLTTTATKNIYAVSTGEQHRMKNTDWLVYYPQYDDVWVTGGKTGYLEESGWNLAVQMQPNGTDTNRSVMIVTFGSSSRRDSFNDAEALAQWAWSSFGWDRGTLKSASRS